MVNRISPQAWFRARQLQSMETIDNTQEPLMIQPRTLSPQEQQLNNSMVLLAILMVLVLIAVILGISLGVTIGKRRD